MGRGCLVRTLLWALLAPALFAAIFLGLRAVVGERARSETDTVALVVASGLAWLGALWLLGAQGYARDWTRLRRSSSGRPPQDGETIAAVGRIEALGRRLESPFRRTPCVLYEWRIGPRGGDSERARGLALTPSAIATPAGSVRLLAFPILQDVREDRVRDDAGVANARAYAESAAWDSSPRESVGSALGQLAAIYTDDDGSIRKDYRLTTGDVYVAGTSLLEKVVPNGAEVCVVGTYSAARGGIVPGTKGIWDAPRLSLGSADLLERTLLLRAIRTLLGTAAFGAASAAVLWLAFFKG